MQADIKLDDDIAVLTFSNPPVNALSHAVRRGIVDAISQLVDQPSVKAVILIGAGKFFCAGADIKEFGKPSLPPILPDVINRLETYGLPIIAALNGTALGGGLELALGCRYRVGAPGIKLGLPEVNLGLIPGAGGTQRLPRLVGTAHAAEMICSGKPVNAKEALDIGLIDEIIEGDFMDGAIAYTRNLIADAENGTAPYRAPLTERNPQKLTDPSWQAADYREGLRKKSRGQISPLKALDAVTLAGTVPFKDGLKREREIFLECMESSQRQGLIHAFFAQRAVGKVPELSGVKPLPIQDVAVLGAGTMGAGIAIAFIEKGFNVLLFDIAPDMLEKGQARIQKTLQRQVDKGRMTQDGKEQALARLSLISKLEEASEADLVIEAVVERMDVKKSVFKDLDRIMKPGAILASNTSYLDINEIAGATNRPDKVVGMHFFSPANLMKLLEVIQAEAASPQTLATVLDVGKRIGKIAVLSGVCDGFIGNRIFKTYRKQAEYLAEDGASPQDVDRVLTEFGFAMGPFAVSDLAGLDIGWHMRRRQDAARDPRERYVDLADRLYDLGRLGQKTGAGWYRYEQRSRTPIIDPDVEELIDSARKEKGLKRREINDDEIRERILFSMINEGAKILESGIAKRALDIDMVFVHGYGFPSYRGGPMFYADTIGAKYIYERILQLAKEDAFAWQASSLLIELAETGGSFKDYSGKDTNGAA